MASTGKNQQRKYQNLLHSLHHENQAKHTDLFKPTNVLHESVSLLSLAELQLKLIQHDNYRIRFRFILVIFLAKYARIQRTCFVSFPNATFKVRIKIIYI